MRIAQRRHRHHRGKAAAVLADVGQFVNVLDAARRLEHQRLEARRDRHAKLDTQFPGPRDDFPRIRNVGWRDLVHHFGGGVAEHALGADVENLDNTLGVGGDAGKIGAVENRALQRAGLEQCFFRLLARGIVGADQQVADDNVLRVAQRGDRDHRREAAAVLADIGQFINVLDAARRLEHQRLETLGNRRGEFGAQRRGARRQFERVGNIGRRDPVDHFGRVIAEHALGADVENLDDALGVGGDAGEIGAVEDGVLESASL